MKKSDQQFGALQIATNKLVNWLFQQKSQLLNNEPDYVIGLFGAQITQASGLYPSGTTRVTLNVPIFKIPDDEKHQPVKQLGAGLTELREDLYDALIFSSVATHEVVPNWSDLDVLIIVKDEAFTDPRRLTTVRLQLLELEQYLYQFDSWQHHGFQFITEADLRFYPETFLPIAALQESASLLHAGTISLQLRDSHQEQEQYFQNVVETLIKARDEGILRHHPKDGIFLENNYANRENSFYQLKYFISVILLLPSLFLGLIEKPISKKESFNQIKNYFKLEELEFLTACEKTRLLFTTLRPEGNAIPLEVESVLGKNYFEQAAQFALRLQATYATHQSTSKKE